jgi:hypothetical protein
MLHLLKTVGDQDFEMPLKVLTTRNYCTCDTNWMAVLNHLATDCGLLQTTFQDKRFGKKFLSSSKIEIIDGGVGLN